MSKKADAPFVITKGKDGKYITLPSNFFEYGGIMPEQLAYALTIKYEVKVTNVDCVKMFNYS